VILLQVDEFNREHSIAFALKTLNSAEKNVYSQLDEETLDVNIIFGINKLNNFLSITQFVML